MRKTSAYLNLAPMHRDLTATIDMQAWSAAPMRTSRQLAGLALGTTYLKSPNPLHPREQRRHRRKFPKCPSRILPPQNPPAPLPVHRLLLPRYATNFSSTYELINCGAATLRPYPDIPRFCNKRETAAHAEATSYRQE